MLSKEEIWQALPAGCYSIAGLMRILEIQESREVPTAAISAGGSAVILVNPDFVARYARTPERQAALILHELMHSFLGHLQQSSTPLENFANDAVINAMICHLTRDRAYWSLFTSFYSSERFPECLLRPPAGFRAGAKEKIVMPRVLADEKMQDAREVLRALYEREGTSYEDILRLFNAWNKSSIGALMEGMNPGVPKTHKSRASGQEMDETARCGGQEEEPAEERERSGARRLSWKRGWLLGSHPPIASLENLNRSGLREACLMVFQDFQQKAFRRSGNRSAIRKRVEIPPSVEKRNTEVLAQLARNVAFASHTEIPLQEMEPVRTLTPVPALDRRSNVLRLLGVPALLHNYDISIPRPLRIDPVHLYVDVSGSVERFVGSLCRAVLQCWKFVVEDIHLFSTRVSSCSLSDLRDGLIHTTGGTDINCVLRHMKRNHIRCALILTDGYVGTPGKQFHSYLQCCRLAVALTPGGSLRDLSPWVRHHAHLLLS